VSSSQSAADPEFWAALRQRRLVPGRDSIAGRVALEGKVVHVADIRSIPDFAVPEGVAAGDRTVLGVSAAPTNKTPDFIAYSDQCCALQHLPPPLSGNISVIGKSLVINHGSCLGSGEAAGIGESAAQALEGRRNPLSC